MVNKISATQEKRFWILRETLVQSGFTPEAVASLRPGVSRDELMARWRNLLSGTQQTPSSHLGNHSQRAALIPPIAYLLLLAALAACSDDNLTPDYPRDIDAGGRYVFDGSLPFDVGPFRRDVNPMDHVDATPEVSCIPDPCRSNIILPSRSRNPETGVCLDFEEVHASAGLEASEAISGLSIIDLDRDGDSDVYVLRNGQPNIFYRNDRGHFTDVSSSLGLGISGNSRAAAWGDYNQDGALDLAIVQAGGTRLYRQVTGFFNEVAAPFGIQDNNPGKTAIWIGINLFLATENGTRYFRYQGREEFTESSIGYGLNHPGDGAAIAASDYDGDGDLDYYLANATGPDRLYQQQSDGHFMAVQDRVGIRTPTDSTYHGTSAQWVSYLPGDRPSLYLGNYSARNFFFSQDRTGMFSEHAGLLGLQDQGRTTRFIWSDFLRDLGNGYPFLALGRWEQENLFLAPEFRSDGSISRYLNYATALGMDLNGRTQGVETLDYNNDGLTDLLVALAPIAPADPRRIGLRLFRNVSRSVRVCPQGRDQ